MKRLFLLSLSVFFIACSSDDDSTGVSIAEADLVGTWDLTSFEQSGSTSTTVAGQTIASTFTAVGSQFDFTTTFTADPNQASSEGTYVIDVRTETAGEVVEEQATVDSNDFDSGALSGTWRIEGDKLLTNESGQDAEYTVTAFSGNSITLNLTLQQSLTIEGQTIDINTSANVTYVKQAAE